MIVWGRTVPLRFLAAAIILFSAAASLYAGGARDGGVLAETDRLIAAKEHDQAIRILA